MPGLINIPIADILLHPPLAFMKLSGISPTVLQPSYSGRSSIQVTTPLLASAFGFTWTALTSPGGAGRSTRVTTIFEEPWFNFATTYKLGDGSTFIADFVETQAAVGYFLFPNSLPSTLEIDVLSGWTVGLAWIVGR